MEPDLARIAYLLLCHKNAERVLEQARILTSRGDYISIHMDANADAGCRRAVQEGVSSNPRAILARSVRCGWGEWSLVQATINMIEAAHAAFDDATHFFLMSGDCMPIKPAGFIHDAVDAQDVDRVEHADFYTDGWIKTGLTEERLIYRHWFNERASKWWFYTSLNLQRRFGLARKVPDGTKMKIGSQWWVLRRSTIDKILEFLVQRRDVVRFFKTTWIPDETFFQTLVMHLVPREEVISEPPTFLMFSDYGMPVTFHSDHYDLLRTQRSLFARKISDNDAGLRKRLGALFSSDEEISETSEFGREVYDYIRRRGREGRRFAPRVWEENATLGLDRHLTVILCKKWHVAGRLVQELQDIGKVPAYGFIFDDEGAQLPDLGNVESTREKRGRHRRAFLKLLYSHHDSKRLVICLDPANIDAVRDFASDVATLRFLEVFCDISDSWLVGHAERIGLGSKAESGDLHAGLMTTLRRNIDDEWADLRGLGLAHYYSISEGDVPGQMARPISAALDVSIDDGARLARIADLFE